MQSTTMTTRQEQQPPAASSSSSSSSSSASSSLQLENIYSEMEAAVPASSRPHVHRILYGATPTPLPLDAHTVAHAETHDYELRAFALTPGVYGHSRDDDTVNAVADGTEAAAEAAAEAATSASSSSPTSAAEAAASPAVLAVSQPDGGPAAAGSGGGGGGVDTRTHTRPRLVRLCAIQHAIVRPTTDATHLQRRAIYARVEQLITGAVAAGANIVTLQEAWACPFFFCTREKQPWCEFAESVDDGPSVTLCRMWARQHHIVIVCPILERDARRQDTLWNTCVVIGPAGNTVGCHRKNHIPRVGDFNESTYYLENDGDCNCRYADATAAAAVAARVARMVRRYTIDGCGDGVVAGADDDGDVGAGVGDDDDDDDTHTANDAAAAAAASCLNAQWHAKRPCHARHAHTQAHGHHPVFVTEFGRIAVNICYGRHFPQNWAAFAKEGADIVVNPSATTDGLSETLWPLEARTAAVANGIFTVAVNRVGSETFPHAFTSGDGRAAKRVFGHFYGSSYVTAPNGERTPPLSRTRDAVLVTEVDLNVCRQTRERWTFQMCERSALYARMAVAHASSSTTAAAVGGGGGGGDTTTTVTTQPQLVVDPLMMRRCCC